MTKRPSLSQPALILVHGFRGSPLGLAEVREALESAGYRVFVPPIPPFAGTKPLSSYSPEAYADYLVKFADDNQLNRPILIGHSMGSIIVAATIAAHSERFHPKAILLSPISERPAAPFRLISPLSALLPCRAIDYITTKFLFIPHDKPLFQHALKLTHDCSDDHPPRKPEVFNAAKFSTHYAVGDFTPAETSEILILAGEKDRLVPKSQTLALADRLRQTASVQTIFLPNSGHLHNYEQPKETASAIINFIED